MKKILIYPNSVLRTKTEEIAAVDRNLIKEIADLVAVLNKSENGAGLAATQIGIKKRFFGLKETETRKVKVIINPKIETVWGEKTFPMLIKDDNKEENFLEGCLSFPNYYGTVKRYLKIKASWDELKKNKFSRVSKILGGFEAVVFQHESDHLDGVLFVDHVKEDGGKLYKWDEEKKMVKWDVKKVIKGEL